MPTGRAYVRFRRKTESHGQAIKVTRMTRSGNANSPCTNRRLPLQSDQPAYTECRLQGYGEISMTKADEDAIRDIELRFNEAWGRHDADGMVESLTHDAQFE